jgi:hypothetical protein
MLQTPAMFGKSNENGCADAGLDDCAWPINV